MQRPVAGFQPQPREHPVEPLRAHRRETRSIHRMIGRDSNDLVQFAARKASSQDMIDILVPGRGISSEIRLAGVREPINAPSQDSEMGKRIEHDVHYMFYTTIGQASRTRARLALQLEANASAVRLMSAFKGAVSPMRTRVYTLQFGL